MKSIYLGTFAVVGTLSQFCDDWGYFKEYNNECMFQCEGSDNYIEINTLSFDPMIINYCSQIEKAYEYGLCNSLDDLVWRDDRCNCPYCSCSSEGLFYRDTTTYQPQLQCDKCICGKIPDYDGIMTDMVYDCQEIINVDNPFDYNFYSCPPNECTATINGENKTVIAGEKWWSECTKFCYCPGNGNTVCETGFSNIIANDDLNIQLINDCSYTLEAVK